MTNYTIWEAQFIERQNQARAALLSMMQATAMKIPEHEKVDLIRALARIARHGFTVNGSGVEK